MQLLVPMPCKRNTLEEVLSRSIAMAKERIQADVDPEKTEPWYYRYQLVFRSYDQAAVAFVLLACSAGMIFYFSYRAHISNGLIDIDHSEPLHPQYLIDINSADWPEIANLPGIGPKLANAIVEFRNQNGLFDDHESLIEVSGIGPAKFERLKNYLAPIGTPVSE